MLWRFSLVDYTTNPSGVTTIVDEPNGWENITMSVRRDEEMHGVFFEFTSNELIFYGEGMAIIRDAYEGYGIEAKVNVVVENSCDGVQWDTFYTGSLVFAKYKHVVGNLCYVSIYSEQNDIVTYFKNRLDQAVDLASTTTFDGTTLPSYTNLPKTQYLVSKGLYKKTDRIMNNNHYVPQSCIARLNDINAGTGLATRSCVVYWGFDFENAQFDEVKNWGAVDNWDYSPNSMNTLTIEDAGQYQIDFRLKGIVLGNAETAAQIVGQSYYNYTNGFSDMWVDIIVSVNFVETIIDSYYLDTTTQNPAIKYHNTGHYGGYSMECYPGYQGDTNPVYNKMDVNNPLVAQIPIDKTYSASMTLSQSDTVAVYIKIRQQGEYHREALNRNDMYWAQRFVKSDDSYFRASIISYKPSTTCDLFLANESFARTTEAITDNKMTVYSDYFGRTDSQPFQANQDGCGSLQAITKGLLIRQQHISGYNPPFNMSFRELFDGMNAIHNIGIGIEDNSYGGTAQKIVRVEPVEHFYDKNTTILTCDKVNQITESVLENRIFSHIEAGYAKYESEEVTGIDEFLSKRSYRTEWKTVRNTANRVCPFIASGYALEVTRRKGHLTTSDWRLDNDVFIICMKRYLGDIVVEQGHISSPLNITDDSTVYNFAISPLRNAARWLKTWFAGITNPYTSRLILTDGTGNYYAGGQYTGACPIDNEVWDESLPLQSNMFVNPDMVLPLWKPKQVQFEYPLSFSEYQILKTNPYGVIKYSCNDNPYQYGYILNIEYKPNTGIANFTLLSANI